VKFLKIGALNGATGIFPYFLDDSADLAKIRHRKSPQNLVNG